MWLKFFETEDPSDYLDNMDIPFDCVFLLAVPSNNTRAKFTLTEVYRVSPTSPVNFFHFGEWSPSVGLISTEDGFYERRRTLDGVVLRTAVLSVSVTTCEL